MTVVNDRQKIYYCSRATKNDTYEEPRIKSLLYFKYSLAEKVEESSLKYGEVIFNIISFRILLVCIFVHHAFNFWFKQMYKLANLFISKNQKIGMIIFSNRGTISLMETSFIFLDSTSSSSATSAYHHLNDSSKSLNKSSVSLIIYPEEFAN